MDERGSELLREIIEERVRGSEDVVMLRCFGFCRKDEEREGETVGNWKVIGTKFAGSSGCGKAEGRSVLDMDCSIIEAARSLDRVILSFGWEIGIAVTILFSAAL